MTEPFARERVMHELRVRRLTVLRSEAVAAGLQRITLTGPELAGFTTIAPGDHVKVFFPDPESGELVAPTMGERGLERPEHGTPISRDYTPYAFRPGSDADAGAGSETAPELDLDFVLHGDNGPASAWAARAAAGDTIAIAGPRGSILPPESPADVVLVADESALPAAARWLDTLAPGTPVTGLFSVADPATAAYLADREAPGRELRWFSGQDRDAELATALRGLNFGERTFCFLAGEAGALIPLRRFLKRELGLRKDQVEVHGYWKRGVVALDHHAPLDPANPDD